MRKAWTYRASSVATSPGRRRACHRPRREVDIARASGPPRDGFPHDARQRAGRVRAPGLPRPRRPHRGRSRPRQRHRHVCRDDAARAPAVESDRPSERVQGAGGTEEDPARPNNPPSGLQSLQINPPIRSNLHVWSIASASSRRRFQHVRRQCDGRSEEVARAGRRTWGPGLPGYPFFAPSPERMPPFGPLRAIPDPASGPSTWIAEHASHCGAGAGAARAQASSGHALSAGRSLLTCCLIGNIVTIERWKEAPNSAVGTRATVSRRPEGRR